QVGTAVPGEARGLGRKIRQDEFHELVLRPGLERRIEAALEAAGRAGLAAEAFAACGAPEMSGENLEVIRQGQDLSVQALVKRGGELRFRAGPDEVGAADPAGEERVAGQDQPGLRGSGLVRDQDRDAVRRVPRRVQDRERDVAQIDPLAVLDVDVWELDRPRPMQDHRGAGRLRETARARQVVGLHVGLEDVRDPHRLLSGGLEIGLDVELWIHHSAGGSPPSAEQVAGAAGLRRQEMTKDHGALLSPLGLYYAHSCYRVQYEVWNSRIGEPEMTLRQLEVFLAVAREKSFSLAARKVHSSQPTLSEHISELEGELGKQLFFRRGRRRVVTVTEAGRVFEQFAE